MTPVMVEPLLKYGPLAVWVLTSSWNPRAPVMWDHHHASGTAERLSDIIKSSEPGEPVKHQYAGSFVPGRPLRLQNLSVDLRTFAFEDQRVIIGKCLR